jgi:hypothetical protein
MTMGKDVLPLLARVQRGTITCASTTDGEVIHSKLRHTVTKRNGNFMRSSPKRRIFPQHRLHSFYYLGNQEDRLCLAGEFARRGARVYAVSKLAG